MWAGAAGNRRQQGGVGSGVGGGGGGAGAAAAAAVAAPKSAGGGRGEGRKAWGPEAKRQGGLAAGEVERVLGLFVGSFIRSFGTCI